MSSKITGKNDNLKTLPDFGKLHKNDRMCTSFFFFFFFGLSFLAIADLKKFSWCNVIQQIKSPRLMLHWSKKSRSLKQISTINDSVVVETRMTHEYIQRSAVSSLNDEMCPFKYNHTCLQTCNYRLFKLIYNEMNHKSKLSMPNNLYSEAKDYGQCERIKHVAYIKTYKTGMSKPNIWIKCHL